MMMTSTPDQTDSKDAPPPVQGFNPIVAGESLSVLLGYEAIIAAVYSTLADYSKYA